jgi:hypothetical protein
LELIAKFFLALVNHIEGSGPSYPITVAVTLSFTA